MNNYILKLPKYKQNKYPIQLYYRYFFQKNKLDDINITL